MKIVPASYEILDRRSLNVFQKIEQAGRLAYKSEDKITTESAEPFVNKLTKAGHYPVIEFANIHVLIEIDWSKVTEQMVSIEIEKLVSFLFPCKYVNLSASFNSIVLSGTVRGFMNDVIQGAPIEKDTLLYLILSAIERGYKDKFPYKIEVGEESTMDGYTCSIVDAETVKQRLRPDQIERHLMCAVKFIHNRAFTHELVRHRIASFIQESQRYCVSGAMKLTVRNPHTKITIKELYEKSLSDNFNRWKKSSIRLLNTNTGAVEYGNINNIVFNGVKPTITLKTKLGYSVTVTKDHEIYTGNEWKKAELFKIGEFIIVNGSTTPYKDKEWIQLHYIDKKMTAVDIARMLNVNISTVKKWIHKLGFHAKMKPNHQIGKVGNSLGVPYRKKGNAVDGYVKGYREHKRLNCEICGASLFLHVHHINENKSDVDPENLITVCPSCHSGIHNKTLLYGIPDKIVSIEDSGNTEVFDIEMRGEFPNFFANGVCVHNCRYSNDKFGNEVTFIAPTAFFKECLNINDPDEEINIWMESCKQSEEAYFKLLKTSSPQAARTVLPNSCKTEIIIFATIEEWRHIFSLRTSAAAEPSMREVMCPLAEEFFSEENQKLWE